MSAWKAYDQRCSCKHVCRVRFRYVCVAVCVCIPGLEAQLAGGALFMDFHSSVAQLLVDRSSICWLIASLFAQNDKIPGSQNQHLVAGFVIWTFNWSKELLLQRKQVSVMKALNGSDAVVWRGRLGLTPAVFVVACWWYVLCYCSGRKHCFWTVYRL